MTTVPKFGRVRRESSGPIMVGPGPDPCFAVIYSDGHREKVEAADEADAMRQANTAYCGPAFVVDVQPIGRSY